jgi:hypothetical protein
VTLDATMWNADRGDGIGPGAVRVAPEGRETVTRTTSRLWWPVGVVLSSVAAYPVISSGTPIDLALPLLVAVITMLAWAAREPAIAIGGPAIMAVELVVAGEHTRLLLLGVIVAAVFALALARNANHFVVATLGIVVLRWIPFEGLLLWRELVLLGSVNVLLALQPRRTRLGVVSAMALVFVTPAAPTRALLTPLATAALLPIRMPAALILGLMAVVVRPPVAELCLMSAFVLVSPLIRNRYLQVPFWIAATLAMSLFAWSGAVARGPFFFFGQHREEPRAAIGIALAATESAELDLAPGTRRLILSAATISPLTKGRVLGSLRFQKAGATGPASRSRWQTPQLIRVGDVSDWGYMRAEQWFRARNPFPRRSAGTLRGYGHDAWVDGAGVIDVPAGATRVSVTADRRLPGGAHLQIEGSE